MVKIQHNPGGKKKSELSLGLLMFQDCFFSYSYIECVCCNNPLKLTESLFYVGTEEPTLLRHI